MVQNSFDQLAKQYLEEFLAPIGQVIRSLEIPGEAKFIIDLNELQSFSDQETSAFRRSRTSTPGL